MWLGSRSLSTSADTAARGTALLPPEESSRSVFVKTHWSLVLAGVTGADAAINFFPAFVRDNRPTDVCVNGIFLNVAVYVR